MKTTFLRVMLGVSFLVLVEGLILLAHALAGDGSESVWGVALLTTFAGAVGSLWFQRALTARVREVKP